MKYLPGTWMLLSMLLIFLSGCEWRSDYQKMVDRELASGVKQDSLFLGIHFGMRADSFYSHCFSLNKQEIIKEGMGNTAVLYEPTEFEEPVGMYFYPEFNQATEGISEMPVVFTYKAWAPWNKHLSADSLLPKVRELFMGWYGGQEFLEVTHPEKGSVWVKVDGNRQIRAFSKDLQFVQVYMTDLTQRETES